MRSLPDELTVLRDLMDRLKGKAIPLPSAPEFLAEHWPEVLPMLNDFAPMRTPVASDTLICMLYRGGRKRFPDNKVGKCDDCKDWVEHRPDAPKRIAKLCVFCTMRRVRGDA